MEHLPRAGRSELATQAELQRVEVALRAEIEHLGTVLRGEMAVMGAQIRAELATAMSGVDRRLVSQTRTLMMGMVAMVISTFGAAATFH